MKPVIIYLDKRDEVRLSKEEFEKYIKEAYDQGYSCGYADGKKYYWSPYWYGNTITSTNTPITLDPYAPTKTTPTNPNITWTCTGAGTDVKLNSNDPTTIGGFTMGEVNNAIGD